MDTHDTGREPHPLAVSSRRWGWLLMLGILLILIGLLALGSAVVATLASVVVLGALALAAGITQIVLAFSARGWRGFSLHLLVGILGAVVGILLMVRPGVGAEALTLVLAAWLLVSGIGQIVDGLSARFHRWGFTVAGGVLSAAIGVLLFLQWPTASLWFLGLCVGAFLVIQGIIWISLAVSVHGAGMPRPLPKH